MCKSEMSPHCPKTQIILLKCKHLIFPAKNIFGQLFSFFSSTNYLSHALFIIVFQILKVPLHLKKFSKMENFSILLFQKVFRKGELFFTCKGKKLL